MLNPLQIQVPRNTVITVIGDIHEHKQQFDEAIKIIKPSSKHWFVSVGDIYNKGYGRDIGDLIVEKIKGLVKDDIGFIIQGNHEQKLLRSAKRSGEKTSDQLRWLGKQPFALSFRFVNGSRLTVVHGGVKPKHGWSDLQGNTDLLYIRTLDEDREPIPLKWQEIDGQRVLKAEKTGRVWHEYYDGRFGYIASGHHAQKDGEPKFYPYSCNLDTACYTTGKLTAQTFSEKGREEFFQISGPAANAGKFFRAND